MSKIEPLCLKRGTHNYRNYSRGVPSSAVSGTCCRVAQVSILRLVDSLFVHSLVSVLPGEKPACFLPPV